MNGLRLFQRVAACVGLIVGSVLLSVAVCEFILRIAGISYPVFETYDELRGVILKPGKEGWYRAEGEAYLKINSLGYRDFEHRLQKPAGIFRLAVLGDSFAEARQISIKDTFWAYLGRHLGQCTALMGKEVEVLNFGIGGYATTEELFTLRKDVLRFSPDLVLLAFYAGNDIPENTREFRQETGWRVHKPLHVLVDGQLVVDDSFRQSMLRRLLYEGVHHFRLLEVLNQARRVWRVRKLRRAAAQAEDRTEYRINVGLFSSPKNAAWRNAWHVTEAILGRINQEVKAHGALFVVTTVPRDVQVHPDPAVRASLERRFGIDLLYPDHRIVDIGRKQGFPVITLARPLRIFSTRNNVYLHGFKNTVMGTGHWNETGHRVAGSVLVQEICAKVLEGS